MKSLEIATRWVLLVGGFALVTGWFVSSLLVRGA